MRLIMFVTIAAVLLSAVSVSSAGILGNDASFGAGLSADGRYAVFSSQASNLVRGDTNNALDVFVRDRDTGTTERVSLSGAGRQGNEESFGTSITPDGRYVAFTSRASNLVPGDTNGQTDAFLRDRRTGRTIRVSVSATGAQGDSESNFPRVSANGRYVVFQSVATNLVDGDTNDTSDVFVRDTRAGTTARVGPGLSPSTSADGRFVAYLSDTGILVRDRQTRTTTPVGAGTSVALTPDGRHVAFGFQGGVYVRDLRAGVAVRIADGTNPVLSDDARVVAYEVHRDGQPQILVTDRRTGVVTAASTAADGSAPDNFSSQPALSGDGRVVAFRSAATNLVPGDTNEVDDTFTRPVG
jgi:Tol biopolymer transport system component